MPRKTTVLLCVMLSASVGSAIPAEAAQHYPVRPIRVVVPQAPGGSTDFTARLVAPLLAERFGHSVVVDNRAGSGSLLGTDLVAKSIPDGYTLLVVASSITINPSMYKKLPFDPVRDFAPVTILSSFSNLMAVHPSLPANSVKELIALAKAKPGALNFASGGTGTATHLVAELFKSMAGIDIVHVPYKGGGPAITALLGNEVHLYFGPINTMLGHVKSGRLKGLAVSSAKRQLAAPDVPSVAESGLPGFEQTTWNGLLAPARTPGAVIQKLSSEVRAILNMALIIERFTRDGVETGGNTPEEFAVMLKREIAKWAKVIREAGINPT